MGMSASQVRYCMLQARKSDIEYQGQQINQQRTTLATQSAAYNTELLTMSVPTPPSTEEFTTTTYSFALNGSDCDIKATNYMTQAYEVDGQKYKAGTYVIDYTTKETKDVASRGSKYDVTPKAVQSGLVTIDGQEYDLYVTINNTPYLLSFVNTDIDDENATVEDIIHKHNIEDVIKNDYPEELEETEETEETGDDEGIDPRGQYLYTEVSPGKYEYFKAEDVIDYCLNMGDAQNKPSAIQSYLVSAQSVDVNKKLYGATINWTDSGRMSSIADSRGRICGLDVNTVADDRAYADAYNEYLYQKDQYNKKMDDINSKLEVIQAQDKKLELQLRNLDTQETAIKTEMDAVKSVCDANIEKSFNVFG